jgi:hypothetical protein
MASIKNLKKDVNFVFGDIIEVVYVWQLANPEKDATSSEAIIDEAIVAFDEVMEQINAKGVDNKKVHFSNLKKSIETKGRALIDKINKL